MNGGVPAAGNYIFIVLNPLLADNKIVLQCNRNALQNGLNSKLSPT